MTHGQVPISHRSGRALSTICVSWSFSVKRNARTCRTLNLKIPARAGPKPSSLLVLQESP